MKNRTSDMRHKFLIALLMGILLWPGCLPAAQLQILTEENPPLNFEKDGRPAGFSVEIVREILRRLKRRDPIRVTPWARGLQMLDTQPNVVLFSTARTAERESRYQWVGPLCIVHWHFFTRADSPVKIGCLKDARRVRAIATYRNDAKERYLKLQGFTNLESSNSPQSNLKKLMSGRVDLWLHPDIGAPLVARKLGIDTAGLKMTLPVTSATLYIAFSRETPSSLVKRWQRTLDGIKKDGTFTAIAARWLPPENFPSDLRPGNTPLTIYTENSPPGNYLENGILKGFAVDVVHEIERRLKRTDPIHTVPWARGYHLAQTRPDTALFSTTRLAQRESLFKWVGPLYSQQWGFYARKGRRLKITSLEDARKISRIGTYRNDAKEQFLKSLGFSNLVSSNKNVSNVKHLLRDNIDLWVSSDFNVHYIARQAGVNPNDIELVFPFHRVENYIAFSRQTPDEVVAAWQQALDTMKEDGTYERLRTGWLPSREGQDQ
jgi:polar amino acid transport system substrate-binding protein